jgi:hypothetical protein
MTTEKLNHLKKSAPGTRFTRDFVIQAIMENQGFLAYHILDNLLSPIEMLPNLERYLGKKLVAVEGHPELVELKNMEAEASDK